MQVVINDNVIIEVDSNRLKEHTVRHRDNISIDTKNINVPMYDINDIIYLESGVSIEYLFNLKVVGKRNDQLICNVVLFDY